MWVSDVNRYSVIQGGLTLKSVPRNYFNVTTTKFVIVDEYQEGPDIDKIDGVPDLIELLYSDEDIDQYVTYPNPKNNGY